MCRSAKRTCSTPPDLGSRLAHRLRERRKCQQGSGRSPPQGRRHAASVGRTSIPCSCSAMRSVIGSGTRRGGQRWPIDKRFARVGGKQTVSSSWPRPFGSSSSGERGWTGCPTHRSMLPPNLRLRPSRSTQLVVLALAIPGANLFSDALLPPLRFQKRRVQKNETHPIHSGKMGSPNVIVNR
jgi:hypothetical protein